jgi:hypothetical protein
MIHQDLRHWPLVMLTIEGMITAEEFVEHLEQWSHWLDRGEEFAALRYCNDPVCLRHPALAQVERDAWFASNGVRLQALVAGLATVVPLRTLDAATTINNAKAIDLPVGTFGSTADALVWIDKRLQANRTTSPHNADHPSNEGRPVCLAPPTSG